MICMFPGTFDPFTLGHLDIARRAAKVFDRVIVAISDNPQKRCMFTLEQRSEMVAAATSGLTNCEVISFKDMLTECCRRVGADIIVRGLRTASDLEYESALSTVYKQQNTKLDTMYFINSPQLSHVHGTIVRDLVRHGADVSEYVPVSSLPLLQKFAMQGD